MPDVVVVGGGAIGLAVAWRVAETGAQVSVVDDAPGQGASRAAAGMLAPVSEAHFGEEALLALNLASRDRWPTFAAELERAAGQPCGYRETGTVVVARDTDDLAAIARLHAFHERLGLDAARLGSRETRRLEPGLAPTVRGGLHVPGDHQVDNRALIDALLAACARAGVRFVAERAGGVSSDAGRATGVELATGRHVPAGAVVLAAGTGSAAVGGLPPGAVPVRPVKGQLLHLRARAGEPDPLTRTIRGLEVYLVPRGDGRLMVGATSEDRDDLSPTAGGVYQLLRAAYELVPGVVELELDEVAVGLRPASPDNAPLIGAGPLEALFVATGHYRNGILLTPITADTLAETIASGHAPALVAPFTPLRFGDRRKEAV